MMCYGQFKLKKPFARFISESSSTVRALRSRGGVTYNTVRFAVFGVDSSDRFVCGHSLSSAASVWSEETGKITSLKTITSLYGEKVGFIDLKCFHFNSSTQLRVLMVYIYILCIYIIFSMKSVVFFVHYPFTC